MGKMFEPSEHSITIRKVIINDEKVFETTIKELPAVAEYADSYLELMNWQLILSKPHPRCLQKLVSHFRRPRNGRQKTGK